MKWNNQLLLVVHLDWTQTRSICSKTDERKDKLSLYRLTLVLLIFDVLYKNRYSLDDLLIYHSYMEIKCSWEDFKNSHFTKRPDLKLTYSK